MIPIYILTGINYHFLKLEFNLNQKNQQFNPENALNFHKQIHFIPEIISN